MSNEPDKSKIPWGQKRDYTEDEARAFWEEARARVKRGECDFEGVYFPEDPSGKGFREIEFQVDAYFSNTKFDGNANFIKAEFGGVANFSLAKFGWKAIFYGAKFGGDANFSSAEFGGKADFWEAKFGGDAYFLRAEFGGDADFREAKFDGKANFLLAEFGGDADFYGAKFGGKAKFENVEFSGEAIFIVAVFGGEANFHEAKFGGDANISCAEFGGEANFLMARFGGDAYFLRAEFGGEADFDKVKFVGDADFEECRFSQNVSMNTAICRGTFTIDLPPKWLWSTERTFVRLGQGYDAYRMAKQSAANLGDYSQAGKYHYAEGSIRCLDKLISGWRMFRGLDKPSKEEEENEETPKAGIKDKLLRLFRIRTWVSLWERLCGAGIFLWAVGELVFGRLLFGYGERIRGILITAFLVIFGWAWWYYPSGIKGIETSFGDCLYFSIVTFTTLGYGDLHPATDMRFWAGTEALAGAFLMALFVVAMARKFTR